MPYTPQIGVVESAVSVLHATRICHHLSYEFYLLDMVLLQRGQTGVDNIYLQLILVFAVGACVLDPFL